MQNNKQNKQNTRPKQSNPQQQLVALTSDIAKQAQKTKPENFTYERAIESYKNKDQYYTQAQDVVKQKKARLSKYDATVGRKMRSTILKELGIPLSDITLQDQKALDYLLIEDDFLEGVKKFASTAGKYLKPLVKPMVQQFAPMLMPLVEDLIPTGSGTVNRQEGIRVRRRYLLRAANQPIIGQVYAIDVNPGLTEFGQWLAIVSKAYQFYEIHSLTFEYISSTALTTAGTISYYMEMDSNAPAPGVNDIGQQYKATTHAMYQNSSVTYNQSEIHQVVRRFHVRNESIDPAESSVYDAGVFYYNCSSVTTNAAGQFFVDIDLSFHVPTLQGLQDEIWSQAIPSSDLSAIKMPPSVTFPIEEGVTRAIQGLTAQAYRVTRSGTLYAQGYGSGTNSATVSILSIYTAADNAAATTAATNMGSRGYTTSGAQSIQISWKLDVTAGSLIYISKQAANEAPNVFNQILISYNPRAFPYATLSQKLGKSQFDEQLQSLSKKEEELTNKVLRQQKILNFLMKQSKQPINLDSSFDFD